MLPTKRMRSWMSFQNLWRTAMKCQISKTSVPSLWRTASETAEQQQDSCPNHAKQRPRTMPKCCLRNALRAEWWASKTFGGPLWNVKHQKLASQAFGGPLAKQPNSSRIRAKSVEWASKTFGGPLWNVRHQKLASKAFGGPREKSQTPSRTQAENGQNRSQKTLSRYLWNPQQQSFGPREISPWGLDAKSPKHHLDTSRKRPKPEPKNSFTLPLKSTKTSFGPREIWPWTTASENLEQQNTSPKASHSKTRCKTVANQPRTGKHKPESL